MTSKMNRLFQRMLSNKGYTIDQTILIVAIIAILITLIIVTVGWQLINRTSGTKVAAQVKQIEDANGQFFSSHRIWPYNAYTAPAPTASANMLALANNGITTWVTPPVDTTKLTNLISGFPVNAGVVKHNVGGGGQISMQVRKYPTTANIGADSRIVIQFENVPLSEAREADRSIDGSLPNSSTDPDIGYDVGRLVYSTSTCFANTATYSATAAITAPVKPVAATSNVTVCYAGNTVQ